jgi:protein-L-isoaspartate O-methyltransferase
MAAQDFGANAVGVEMREDLAKQATGRVSELGLDGRVKIVNGDMFKLDLSQANVVTLYLTTSANDKVKPKLEAELKPGARVVSHDYEILGWKPIKVDNFCENPRLGYPSHTIYVYRK